jgi:uncharacterized protein YbjT (DUF2867 family)
MSYLITGATGNVGGRVVERLVARGLRPRVLVRDAAKTRARFGERVELVLGDLAEPGSLARALSGVEVLFLLNSGPELAARDALAAGLARRAGVRRLVKLSALGARSRGEETAVARWHAEGEAAIRATGVAYTFVQPVGFMSNALAWAHGIKRDGVVRASTGGGRIAMIHPDDIAAVAVEALTSDRYDGQSLVITGPEALSYAEMTGKIAAELGRPLTFQAISDAEARQNLLAHGLSAELADALVMLWREVREGKVAIVTREVERVTGRPAIAFDTWVRENAAAFC